MEHDILELEVAFQAFAQVAIDRMLLAKTCTAEEISAELLVVAAQVRESGHFQSASMLERLAAFSEARGSAIFLLDSESTGGLQ